jgi:hypothetical protein
MKADIRTVIPAMVKHEGTWEGTYRYIDENANQVDIHQSRVKCIFPEQGPYAYIQKNHFTWSDGREYSVDLLGTLKGDKVYWDTDTFQGYGWATDDGIILLNLERKDEPGARFYEMIVMDPGGVHRARTWHWFKNGQCYKRTLCDERRAA